MPSKFIPERYSSESEYYKTPSGEKRHSLAWCPFITGKRHCLGKEFVFMIAKTVVSMFLTAMPDLDFSESDLHKLDEMPSSAPNSNITVEVSAKVPFKL